MGFSITSAVLGGVIIICFSLSIAQCRQERKDLEDRYPHYYVPFYRNRELKNYEPEIAINAMIIILGIVEFVIGIWAPICCCVMNPCSCCVPRQQVRIPKTKKKHMNKKKNKQTNKSSILLIPLAENFLGSVVQNRLKLTED